MTQRTEVTALDLKTRFPEFASIPDSRVQFMIEFADNWIKTGFDGTPDRVLGRMLLAAHLLVIMGSGTSVVGGGSSGIVVSESLGDASVTYADLTKMISSGSDFDTSVYGKQYKKMAYRNRGGPRIL